MALPTFIGIGPGRAGTSWLYEVLAEHPQVGMARHLKETQFFNANYHRGLGWYASFFEQVADRPARGEISNRYIFSEGVAERIAAHIPGCRIITTLRNPYDRIQSVYGFWLREGKIGCSFAEAIEAMPELIAENRYDALLAPYYRRFPGDRIFPMLYDDLCEHPLRLCRNLFHFLGVDEDFEPRAARVRFNPAVAPRARWLATTAKKTAEALRGLHLYRPLTWGKRSPWLRRLLYTDYDFARQGLLTRELRARLDSVLLPEIERLEKLVGRSLAGWKLRIDGQR